MTKLDDFKEEIAAQNTKCFFDNLYLLHEHNWKQSRTSSQNKLSDNIVFHQISIEQHINYRLSFEQKIIDFHTFRQNGK